MGVKEINTCVCVLFFIFLGVPNPLQAQDTGDNPLDFGIEPEWIGLTLAVHDRLPDIFPGLKSKLDARIGISCDTFGYFLTPDGAPYAGNEQGYDPLKCPWYDRATGHWELEFTQGVVGAGQANLLEFFFQYRFKYYRNFRNSDIAQLLFACSLPDKDEQLQSSFLTGLSWNNLEVSLAHALYSGIKAEISLEYGPWWLLNSIAGESDFWRVNLSTSFFLPIFDLKIDSPLNVLSGYLGVYFSLDYAWGSYLPLDIRETFGGRTSRKGLGFALRGIEDSRFAAPLKAVNNLELRVNLPALFIKDIVPGILIFLDSGYYRFSSSQDGFLCSTGAALYLNLFNTIALTFSTQYLLVGTRLDGSRWTPFYFEFSFHF